MGELVGIFIVGIVTLGIYRIIELYVRKNERMAIIERIGDRIKQSDVDSLNLNLPFFQKQSTSFLALKFALLLIGIGLGAIIGFFIYYNIMGNTLTVNFNDWEIQSNLRGTRDIIYFSCISVFGGLGLLIAYFIERRDTEKKRI